MHDALSQEDRESVGTRVLRKIDGRLAHRRDAEHRCPRTAAGISRERYGRDEFRLKSAHTPFVPAGQVFYSLALQRKPRTARRPSGAFADPVALGDPQPNGAIPPAQ